MAGVDSSSAVHALLLNAPCHLPGTSPHGPGCKNNYGVLVVLSADAAACVGVRNIYIIRWALFVLRQKYASIKTVNDLVADLLLLLNCKPVRHYRQLR